MCSREAASVDRDRVMSCDGVGGDCYLRVDNQTSGHDVISDGVMRPTLYHQSSRFPVDQLLLLALIP